MQIIVVKNITEGIEKIKEELYQRVDGKTVLFLSGGKTPKPLYEVLAKEKILKPAAVAMIDERYGEPMHENSNEKMIAETGLLSFFKSKGVPFYGILKQLRPLGATAAEYDQTVRKLMLHFPKSIGILGIGADGHTAGIPASHLQHPISDLVTSYTDTTGTYGQRITLTFSALSLLDYLIVFVFGKDKKNALKKVLEPAVAEAIAGEEIPARFYQKPEITKKTLVITDQEV